MNCEYCGCDLSDRDWGDVNGAIVCYDCMKETIIDQNLQSKPEWAELLHELEQED